jgi:hypothetical protein
MLRNAPAATLVAALALSTPAFAQTAAPMPDDKTMGDKTMAKPMQHPMHHSKMHHKMHKPMAKPMSGETKQM